jgi:hypothetical protein
MVAARDTVLTGEGQEEYISGFEGSKTVPAHHSATDNAYDQI